MNDNIGDNDKTDLKLVEFKTKQQQDAEKLEENIHEAIQDVVNRVDFDTTKALFLVAFDEEGNPNIFFAGSMDPFKMIGVLDTAKALFLPEMPTGGYMDYEGLDDIE